MARVPGDIGLFTLTWCRVVPGARPLTDGGPAPATTTPIDRNLANQVGSDHFS